MVFHLILPSISLVRERAGARPYRRLRAIKSVTLKLIAQRLQMGRWTARGNRIYHMKESFCVNTLD
jgi:hypothetical protein